MNIRTFDLNLLKAFDALLEECSVSRAAARVHLSQPAMSNALARLRDAIDDPVLVRTPHGMEPTARALALKGPVRQALLQIETALSAQPEFSPGSAKRTFVVAATDYMEFLVLPRLMHLLEEHAPGIDIRVRSLQLNAPEEPLDSGDVDLAFGFFADVPKRLNRRHLFTETMTCLVRAGYHRDTAEPIILVLTRWGVWSPSARQLSAYGVETSGRLSAMLAPALTKTAAVPAALAAHASVILVDDPTGPASNTGAPVTRPPACAPGSPLG